MGPVFSPENFRELDLAKKQAMACLYERKRELKITEFLDFQTILISQLDLLIPLGQVFIFSIP